MKSGSIDVIVKSRRSMDKDKRQKESYYYTDTGTKVLFKLEAANAHTDHHDFYEEILTSIKFDHENVVKCYGWYREPTHEIPCMISEYMEQGDLKRILDRSIFT